MGRLMHKEDLARRMAGAVNMTQLLVGLLREISPATSAQTGGALHHEGHNPHSDNKDDKRSLSNTSSRKTPFLGLPSRSPSGIESTAYHGRLGATAESRAAIPPASPQG